ncbi:MAG: hypothetical protein GDA54_00440 [Alphaproteobacteria bacterium GM7ARS4]|nr:hypothetical protein [Alphaproteobacteria bacterium GM7ARS4]
MPLTPTSSATPPPYLPKDFYAVTSDHDHIRFTKDKKSLVHGEKKDLSFSNIKSMVSSSAVAAATGGTLASRKVYHVVSDGRSIDKKQLLSKQESRLHICQSFSDAMRQTLQDSINKFDAARAESPLKQEDIDDLESDFGALMKNTKNLVSQKLEGLLNASLTASYASDVSLSGQDFRDVFDAYSELLGTLLDEANEMTAKMNPPSSTSPYPDFVPAGPRTTSETEATPPPVPKKTHSPLTRVATHARPSPPRRPPPPPPTQHKANVDYPKPRPPLSTIQEE